MKMRSTAGRASKQTADRDKVLCLLQKMPKGLFTFIRLFILLLSFSTICLGVLCMSMNSSMCRCGNNMLVFYCLLALGLFLLITGIFWSTFHEVLKYRALGIFIRNPSHRELHVCTIDRYVLQMNWEGGMLFFKHTERRKKQYKVFIKCNPVAILLFFCGENGSLKFHLLEQAAMWKQPFMQTILHETEKVSEFPKLPKSCMDAAGAPIPTSRSSILSFISTDKLRCCCGVGTHVGYQS